MSSPTLTPKFPSHLGCQRNWLWRGWHIRYTYLRPGSAATRENSPPTNREFPPITKPLLFLHGFGSALGQWRYNLQPLSQNHWVYALDFLGFGASQKAPAHYNINLWSELVYDFWRCMIGEPAVVIGHSLGALVALNTVAHHPEMVSDLVLLTLPDTQSNQPPAVARYLEKFLASPIILAPFFRLIRRPAVLRSVLQKIYRRPELVDQELVDLFATPPQDRGALDVFCRLARSRNNPEYGTKSLPDLLSKVAMPILVIWGQQDQIVPLQGFRRYLALNPQLTLIEIAQAGHCAYDEYPEQINQAILDWIAKSK